MLTSILCPRAPHPTPQVLEHTLEERAKDVSRQLKEAKDAEGGTPQSSALELRDFMRRVREGGEAVTRER
eukprot:scaffold20040_cov101-Isochrysis_galbana.AAC.3